LEFDGKVRKEIDTRWHDAQVKDRLWYTAGGTAGVLALLCAVFGYLKFTPQ
jgi:hypothetical protein